MKRKGQRWQGRGPLSQVKTSGGGGHSRSGGQNKQQRPPGRAVLQPCRGQQQHNHNNHNNSMHSSLTLCSWTSLAWILVPFARSSLEPAQHDEMTGRVYFTANGEKVYDKGVQHVRGTVKGACAPVDVKLRVADIREGLLSVPEIVDK
eukprot:2659728-Amphidinium_carterae.1